MLVVYLSAKIQNISDIPNFSGLFFANESGHIVEGHTLVAADGRKVDIITPRKQKEKTQIYLVFRSLIRIFAVIKLKTRWVISNELC